MDYREAIAYILEIPKFTKKNSLKHTKEFLNRLGNPERERKIIHVAGTNGKGSVCAYMQSLLLSEKKTVGFFTSPHLVKMNERIRIDGEEISDELFLRTFHIVLDVVQNMEREGKPHPTFFEFLFGMAMAAFAQRDVEYIILETGLGGRMDATNAIEHPFLTIITSISLDHTEILGDTIEQIAAEKAGIIKPHVPVIYAKGEEETAGVIRAYAKKVGAPCREISKNAYEIQEITGKDIAFSGTNAYYENSIWRLRTKALYQVENAMLALEAMRVIAGDEKHFARWKEAMYGMRWEGRMEEIKPGVILDGAHNPGAVKAFIETVQAEQNGDSEQILLFSAVREKEYETMIRMLCVSMDIRTYILTQIGGERGVSVTELETVFRKYTDRTIITEENPGKALSTALREKGEKGRVYCLGSLYLIGAIKELIVGGKEDA